PIPSITINSLFLLSTISILQDKKIKLEKYQSPFYRHSQKSHDKLNVIKKNNQLNLKNFDGGPYWT
ncbi:hypothetical protein, partial [Gilliamella apicola]|uniref:hypothetical protein n=1 Tax=Gilliamella apicola TaxID=1196095 RepID=UPI001C0A9435